MAHSSLKKSYLAGPLILLLYMLVGGGSGSVYPLHQPTYVPVGAAADQTHLQPCLSCKLEDTAA